MWLIRFALSAILILIAPFAVGLAPAQAREAARPDDPQTVTFTPAEIPFSAKEIPNSFRGQYSWLGTDAQPANWPMRDTYWRDQVAWSRIEASRGTLDLGWFEDGLQRAEAKNGRLGFRVMAYCPGCWMNATPDWIPKQPGTDIPDWNSETFLSAWESLMTRLGELYADDPRLGWLDVGGYGKWGEWHVSEGEEISDASATRVIEAVLDNFPKQHVVINAMMPRLTELAMNLSPRIGLRTDCLGEYNMYSLIPTSPSLQQRWKTAPVISEWCGTWGTSPTLGASQVSQYHVSQTSSGNLKVPYTQMTPEEQQGYVDAVKHAGYRYVLREVTMPAEISADTPFEMSSTWSNVGSAPTYDGWQVRLELRNASNAVGGAVATAINLKTLLSGTKTYPRTVTIKKIKPGTYTATIVVRSNDGYLPPMNLATEGRMGNGSYPLGTVTVLDPG